MEQREIDTPRGPARAHLHPVEAPRALLVLGHGAGGGVTAPDLVTATEEANRAGVSVALVEQPYKVAGRKSPAPAHQLDAAWLAVVDALRGDEPVLCGGRSSGARVACRTAAGTGAVGVLCLAFPLHPPGRPERSRAPELELVDLPLLCVQGTSDSFGRPEEVAAVVGGEKVRAVAGDHGKPARPAEVGALVVEWLAALAGPQA
jgi:predicted alpha/beta-hydrolase family hydrolase